MRRDPRSRSQVVAGTKINRECRGRRYRPARAARDVLIKGARAPRPRGGGGLSSVNSEEAADDPTSRFDFLSRDSAVDQALSPILMIIG